MAKAAKSGAPSKQPVKKITAPKAAKAVSAKRSGTTVKPAAAKTPKAPASGEVKPVVEPTNKVKRHKLVRDSFTMPEAEHAVLGEVKKACLKAGIEVKKSELLRVGVVLIRQLDPARLKEILAGLPTLKAGRPKKRT